MVDFYQHDRPRPSQSGPAPRLYPYDLHSCDDISSLPTGMVYFQATTEGFVSLMSFPYSRKLGALKGKSLIFIIALGFNQFSLPGISELRDKSKPFK